MSEPIVYCYSRCSTCKKALKWLKEHHITVEEKEITQTPPSSEQFLDYFKSSGLPVKRFFNTSGNKYRELGLKDKLDTMTDEEKAELLAADGMLIKRPLLIVDDKAYPGFKPELWEDVLS